MVAHRGRPDDRCEGTGTSSVDLSIILGLGGTNPFCIADFVLESGRVIQLAVLACNAAWLGGGGSNVELCFEDLVAIDSSRAAVACRDWVRVWAVLPAVGWGTVKCQPGQYSRTSPLAV